MDGTLVDSLAGVTAAWEAILKEYPGQGLSVEEILSCGFFLVASFGAYNLVVCSISWDQNRRKPS
jgi:hypothetical protein